MTPKEKAKELVNKYLDNIPFADNSIERAKQCALISVDELIQNSFPGVIKCHWEEVKHEINQL